MQLMKVYVAKMFGNQLLISVLLYIFACDLFAYIELCSIEHLCMVSLSPSSHGHAIGSNPSQLTWGLPQFVCFCHVGMVSGVGT